MPPEDTVTLELLETCLKKIEETTTKINEGKRLAEKLQRIVEIQDSIDERLVMIEVVFNRKIVGFGGNQSNFY